jgi:hypothetical protein
MGAIHQPWYAGAPAIPACLQTLVMTKQAQTAGGASVGDGMAQSGAAVSARSAFLAALSSYVTADLNHVTASVSVEYDINNPLSLWSGFGELRGKGDVTNFDSNMRVADGTINDIGNGRFNTSANVRGNWYVSPLGWDITLAATRTAFGLYVMDLGDVREGEIELRLYSGSTLVRIIAPPTVFADKARTNEGMWIGYANGNTEFDRIECVLRQHSANPAQWDFVGYDDFAVGQCIACVPSTLPIIHYGANTAGDAAKTVTGAALTARNSFVAALASSGLCDFEANSLGSAPAAMALAFTGALSSVTATITCNQYDSTHTTVAVSTSDMIDNSGASARWNTTPSGSKWYEFTDEVVIQLSAPVTAVGFYITDLGNQNATLRVTLRKADGTGISHYVPKGTSLPETASLLRFWGVTGETSFTQIILQTVYYTTLTVLEFENPVFHVKGTPDMVGLDDLLIGN